MHSSSDLEHLLRANSRHTSSVNQRESLLPPPPPLPLTTELPATGPIMTGMSCAAVDGPAVTAPFTSDITANEDGKKERTGDGNESAIERNNNPETELDWLGNRKFDC